MFQGADAPQQFRGILQPFAAVQAQVQAPQGARQRRGAAQEAQGAAAAEAQREVLVGPKGPQWAQKELEKLEKLDSSFPKMWRTET